MVWPTLGSRKAKEQNRLPGKITSLAVAEMGDRLVTIDMGRKWGQPCPFPWGGELDPHLTQCGRGRNLHAKYHLDPSNRLATIHQRYRQTGQTTAR